MDIDTMLVDFCKRAKTDYTPEHIKSIMNGNYTIMSEDGFMVFNFVLDEAQVFFCYVVPGRPNTFHEFVKTIELLAKSKGCKKVKFVTKRDKAFARALPDYKPCAVMFEKGLI